MTQTLQTQCCIAGGGPAGVMLGYLLARAGVDVIVLEKHKDFFRDFRGDTIHPSTMEVLHELGLLDEFLQLHHQKIERLSFNFNGRKVQMVDFTHLPVHAPYIALIPQWDFLNFIADKGKKYPQFHLRQSAEVTDIITEHDKVCGVKVKTPDGDMEVRADLVIGADGRSSLVRDRAGLEVNEKGVPIDVLWLRIPKSRDMHEQSLGNIHGNNMIVLIDRDDYYQCGYIIPKGKYDEIKARGLEAFRQSIVDMVPYTAPYIQAVDSWDDVKLLTVQINYLTTWYRDGLLCIGDAAHAMSPVGGVGINLAIQDAIAGANILSKAFRAGKVDITTLAQVQQRREMPARRIQSIQSFIHDKIVNPTGDIKGSPYLKIVQWLFGHFPILRRIPARVVGMGFRPEHVEG